MNNGTNDNNNINTNATLGLIPVLDGYFFAYLTLFALGFVFNFVTLITLSHSSLREWSTRVFLAALSIIDLAALLLTFLLVLQDYRIVILAGQKSCKFFAYFMRCILTSSYWTVVAITLE